MGYVKSAHMYYLKNHMYNKMNCKHLFWSFHLNNVSATSQRQIVLP